LIDVKRCCVVVHGPIDRSMSSDRARIDRLLSTQKLNTTQRRSITDIT